MVVGPLPLSNRNEGRRSEATRVYSSNGLSGLPRRVIHKGCGAPWRKGVGDGRAVVMNSESPTGLSGAILYRSASGRDRASNGLTFQWGFCLNCALAIG